MLLFGGAKDENDFEARIVGSIFHPGLLKFQYVINALAKWTARTKKSAIFHL